jgi:D-aspartate ligase
MMLMRSGRRRFGAPRPPGAVVIGGDYLGVGIARSLGPRGIPICVLDDEFSITRFSRHTRYSARARQLREDDVARDALLALDRRFGLAGWVLFPTRDELVDAIAKHRAVLSTRFRVPIPEWETVRWASDKRLTYELAERLGIPVPRTWYPTTTDDLLSIDSSPPLAVKPAIKHRFIYATGAKAWRANTGPELRRLFERAREVTRRPGEVMVQEIIPGGGESQFAFCTFFKDGLSLGSMVVRRRRQHPHEFGRATTFAETLELATLQERSERLLRALDYYGLAELEYKRDPRDGEFKLLDFNARIWGYHTLGWRAGVDFPWLVFMDQLGKAVPTQRARAGVRWMRIATDLPTLAVDLWSRRQRPSDVVRSLASGIDVEAVFSREDPAPALAEIALLPYLALKRGF